LVALEFDQGVVVGAGILRNLCLWIRQQTSWLERFTTITRTLEDGDNDGLPIRSGCVKRSRKIWGNTSINNQKTSVTQVAHFLRHLIRRQGESLQTSLICPVS